MTSEALAAIEPNGSGQSSLVQFFIETGRLPFVDDEVKPWQYRGWLIPYILLAEAHPQVSPRYDYVTRTIENNALLDEPLPQIDLIGESDPRAAAGTKQLAKMVDIVGYRSTGYNGFRDIADWLGFALAVTGEPSKLDDDLQEKLYRFFNLEHWLLNPTDYLGQFLCEIQHNTRGGFFPTPMHVCTMMTSITFGHSKDRDQRSMTVNDPCVGTGRFLLAASNYSMRLSGNDIDGLVVLCSKINLALYAPWFHIPESFWPADPIIETTCEASPVAKTSPETAIEQLRPIVQGQGSAGKSKKKVYTTEIEQPTLFGME